MSNYIKKSLQTMVLIQVFAVTPVLALDECKQESTAKKNFNRDCVSFLMAEVGTNVVLTGRKPSSDVEGKIDQYCNCLSTKAPVHRFAEKDCRYLPSEIKDSINADGAIRLCGPHPK